MPSSITVVMPDGKIFTTSNFTEIVPPQEVVETVEPSVVEPSVEAPVETPTEVPLG